MAIGGAPAFRIRSNMAVSSVLPTDNDVAVGGARGANPVNSTDFGNTRLVVPDAGGVASRASVQASRNVNPRLNTLPWSTSMAQPRTETRSTQKKRRKKGYNQV